MKNNRILALSMASLLVSYHSGATAAAADITLTAAGSNTPVAFAKELPSGTTNLLLNKVIANLAPVGVKVTPTNPVYVKFKLLNGATFIAAPTLKCASGAGANFGVTGSRTNGGAGFSAVTFQIRPAGSATLGTACQLTMTSVKVSGLTDKSVSATVEYSDAGVGKVLSSKGKFITFAQGLQVVYTPNGSPSKIDVGQNSKKLITGSTSIKTAYLGSVKYDKLGAGAFSTAGAAITVTGVLSKANLVISGPAIGSVHTGNVGLSGIFLNKVPGSCKNANVGITTSGTRTYSGTTVTFNGIGATALLNGVGVCLVASGSTVIADGQITASLSGATVVNSMQPDLTSTRSALATLKKNGAATKALVLPNPESTDKPYVRIYNIGTSGGRVLGTLYGVDGKVIASGVLATSLAPNAVVVLDAAAIAKALGITTWTSRPWLQIEAEFQGLRAQALIRSSTGVLTEFSDGACGTSTLCGDAAQ